jgi:hypothetical protein
MVPSFAVDEWKQLFYKVLVCPKHYRERGCSPRAVAILKEGRDPMEVVLDWDEDEESQLDEFLSRCIDNTYYDRSQRRYEHAK